MKKSNSGEKNSNLIKTSTHNTGSFLDKALQDLPAESRNRLAETALEKRMEIESERIKAQDRFNNSSSDMGEMNRQLRSLQEGSQGADYTVEGRYQTASGTTNVRVQKNSNTMLIVGVVVVAVVLLFVIGG